MARPLGDAGGRSDNGHHQSWRRRWRAPWGVLPIGPGAATTDVKDVDVLPVGPVMTTTEVGDVDGGPPGGATGISGSGHHWSPSGIHEVPELKVQERPPPT
jgi:hypothetical protein